MKVSKRSPNGFSLVEVLIALAVSGIVGMVVLQTMQDSTNTMALSEAKFEELELTRQIQTALVYKPSCEKTLQGKVLDNLTIADVQKLVDSKDIAFLKVGDIVGNRSLRVSDFKFEISPAAKTEFDAFKAAVPAGATTHMMDVNFVLTTEKLKTSMGGKALKARSIPIKVKVDASNVVQECFAATDASDYTAMVNFCTQMGGSFNSTTNLCEFNQPCSSYASAQMIPARCVDAKMKELNDSIYATMLELIKDRAPATVAAATPAPSATPSTLDPYTLPFSIMNPGKGCDGDGCAASDFGPCKGTSCTTNGGSCTGLWCTTGKTTGTVAWDGKNPFTPANPGPGCKGDGCHASDYGPCKGTSCTTNGGSCSGLWCTTGKNK